MATNGLRNNGETIAWLPTAYETTRKPSPTEGRIGVSGRLGDAPPAPQDGFINSIVQGNEHVKKSSTAPGMVPRQESDVKERDTEKCMKKLGEKVESKSMGYPASDRYPVLRRLKPPRSESAFDTNIVAQVARSVNGQIVRTAPEFGQEVLITAFKKQ
jgi:hypothetical protein